MNSRTLVGSCAIAVGIGFSYVTNCRAEPVRFAGHQGSVGAVALSPDGEIAASSDKSLIVRVWNTADGTEIRQFQVFPPDAPYGFISSMDISPDGKLLAIAAWKQPISFWNLATGERQENTLPVRQAAYSLAFSPDGEKLAVGESAQVKIWDLRSNKVLHDLRFDPNLIGSPSRVAFSPDGTLLAAALRHSGGSFAAVPPKVRVWEVATGREIFSAWPSSDSTAVVPLPRSAIAVSISSDGKLAAGGGQWIEIWDIGTQQSLNRLPLG